MNINITGLTVSVADNRQIMNMGTRNSKTYAIGIIFTHALMKPMHVCLRKLINFCCADNYREI